MIPNRRPRRDYNTYERPRYNNEDGIIVERPRRDRDRERIERRRDDNARQFENDQSNRRERDRERIERRNRNSEQQVERPRNNRQERSRGGDDVYRNGEVNGRKIGGPQGGGDCRPQAT
ncbi:hypothetical protein LP421_12700 [Rhizobium sp. RCAM05350]|nr:hypothetical protein LP421_12700 [Rhizobium sp. RCAM05350]